jgi:hypothetical protein
MASLIYYATGWPTSYHNHVVTNSFHDDFPPQDTWTVAQLHVCGFEPQYYPPGDPHQTTFTYFFPTGLLLGFTHVSWLDENGLPQHDYWDAQDPSIVTLSRYRLTRIDYTVRARNCVGRWVMNLFA